MTILQHSIAQAAAAASGYQIARSLRFNSADSANLSRTFAASPTVRTKQTISCWVKRSAVGVGQAIFSGYDGSSAQSTSLYFTSGDLLAIDIGGGATNSLITTQVFRDPSAFFHLHVEIDTTQATASNRVKMYANGQQITAFGTANYPAQNAVTQFALANGNNKIGSGWNNGAYLSAYLADLFFIDGQALTPSSFGETDANTGVWVPKTYAGTFGTNGFWLKFDDNSGTTATTLGKDSSGNSNNWTPNNFSVTAGAGNDSLVDSPTNYGTDTGAGGEVRGNYCTLNPLSNNISTYSNGNLDVATTTTINHTRGTFGVTSGKWYWECVATTTGADILVGYVTQNAAITAYPGQDANGWGYYSNTGNKYNGAGAVAYGAAYAANDIVGVAFDADAGTLTFYKNGVSQGTAFTGLTNGPYFPAVGNGGNLARTYTVNFGQRPFAYTAPSGFRALNTQNLPTPAIGTSSTTQANRYFDVVTYTGNGSARSITGVNFQPDLVWAKGRSGATDHAIYDRVRGVQLDLVTNSTAAETTQAQGVTAFNSDGFSIGTLAKLNTNAATYVGWVWRANGAPASNTAGTITSQVSVNTTAGISVVTYTGNGALATIGHGLGAAPRMIIVKNRGNGTIAWVVYHVSTGKDAYLQLNATNASTSTTNYWGSANPTSTVFGADAYGGVNSSANTYVAYCFAEVPGFSRFGSYTGNGSTDGPFVYCGFRPRWILVKRTDTAGTGWAIYDTSRDSYNVEQQYLGPESSAAESAITFADGLSNGFKLRTVTGSFNASGGTYIFAAFAEAAFNFSRAR